MQAEKLRECEPIAVDMGQEEPDHEWDRSNERVSGVSKGRCERAQTRPLTPSRCAAWARSKGSRPSRVDTVEAVPSSGFGRSLTGGGIVSPVQVGHGGLCKLSVSTLLVRRVSHGRWPTRIRICAARSESSAHDSRGREERTRDAQRANA